MSRSARPGLLRAPNWFSWFVSIVLLVVLGGLTLGLHRTLENAETAAVERRLDAITAQIETDLLRAAGEHVAIQRRMAQRLQMRPGESAWRADARRLLDDFPFYSLLAVLDGDLRVQWLESEDEVRLRQGQVLPVSGRSRRLLDDAVEEAEALLLEPVQVGDGHGGLLFMTPIESGGAPVRWLAAVLVVSDAVAAVLDPFYLDDVDVEARFAGTRFTLPAGLDGPADGANPHRSLAIRLDDGESVVHFDVELRAEARDELASGLPEAVLGLGSILALLASAIALLAMAAARQARGLAHANRTLNDEIRDRELAERGLEFLVSHDSLTGLPNRQGVLDALHQAIRRYRRGRVLAVLYIDLDRFKDINETLGHHLGDQLLTQVPARVGDALDPADRLGRLGGDEFLIVAERASEDRIRDLANDVLERLGGVFELEEHQLFVTASIGFATFDGQQIPSELVQNADAALFRAKHLGRNQVAQFTREMFEDVERRLVMSRDIRRALDESEFEVVYQPVVDLSTLEMSGVEALLRWRGPDGDEVAPGEFIRVAEETGLVHRLSRFAIRRALSDLAAWQSEFGQGPWLAVNISGAQFREPGFVDDVRTLLEAAAVPAERVHLEITEDVLIENLARNRAVLEQLDALGLTLVVDDFGVGYSSMAYIKNFPVSTIKIDQGFVRDLEVDREDQAITRTICNLARSLGLATVAEGIEQPAQLQALRSYGCPLGQGYLFLEPSGPEVIRSILAGERPWSERASATHA